MTGLGATIVGAVVVTVVGLVVTWTVRRAARAAAALALDLVDQLREIARIPAVVAELVTVVAQLVTELRAAKRRLDELETAFAALDLTPDHVSLTMLATDPEHRERAGV